MRLDVIDNSGATSMIAELRNELEICKKARMATASLTRSGIVFIEEALGDGRKDLHIQLLIGLYNGHTEAAALRRLFSLQKRFAQLLEIRIARNERFHWKTYLFESKGRAAAFVGSSNLTKDGLGVEGEFNIRLVANNMGGTFGHIADTFDREWARNSVPLNIGIAEGFAETSNRSKEFTRQIDPIIKELLRKPRRNRVRKTPQISSIMTSIEGPVGQATIKAVKDKTDWYRKNWQWMVCRRQADRERLFKPGGFYLAEFQGKNVRLSLNDCCAKDEFTTEDGRFLIAYQKRRGSVTKTVSPKTLILLKQAGVIKEKEDLRRDRRLSRASREALDAVLRVPQR